MATISDLATLASAAGGDLLVIRRGTTDYKIDAGLVPWTNIASTFTKPITIADTSTAYAYTVATPAGLNQRVLRWTYDGALRGYINNFPGENSLTLLAFDNGAGIGSYVSIQRNSNGTTPAAGVLYMQQRTSTPTRRIWVDDTGRLRIHTSDPLNASDQAGTVVGDQAAPSALAFKHVIGNAVSGAEALAFVAKGAAAVRRFTYKDGAYNGEEFSGLIVDYAPRYGKDKSSDYPSGQVLNTITAIGDLMIAVSHLASRISALEHK